MTCLFSKNSTVTVTETMTSPRGLSIKHLKVRDNNNNKMCDLRKAINSPEILSVKEGKGNNALSDTVELETQPEMLLTMKSKRHMPQSEVKDETQAGC